MKLLVVLCVLTFVALLSAKPDGYPRGCLYASGKCIRACEIGTYAYTTGCSQKTPEPNCYEPNPKTEGPIVCNFSACYCEQPTVRDLITGQCVTLDECIK
ncbi:unnamed protein product [Arctia plantaginis]|uniref:Protease inhibitor n=1 Tax=Arctia plantaginis TaxID=874455 RepID=A0A8S0YZZ0_ARCPL|nr:unnamed protein product [Arctia plantaginis]